MSLCRKRQKIVSRPSGQVRFRCLNKRCGVHKKEVDETTCKSCLVPVLKKRKPCRDPLQPVTTDEANAVSDEEVLQMAKDAGLDVSDLYVDSPDYPSMAMQLWTYKEALIRWHRAGRPIRTQEEVEHLHTAHCKPCDWYDKEAKRCRGCGCKVTLSSFAIFNKLKMATEQCSEGKW